MIQLIIQIFKNVLFLEAILDSCGSAISFKNMLRIVRDAMISHSFLTVFSTIVNILKKGKRVFSFFGTFLSGHLR